jgi:hypothetical protein
MNAVTVVCMKWDTRYGPEYVNRLHAGVVRHLARPFRFVCFTDNARRLMNIAPRWQRLAKHEFKTRQRPSLREFLDYSRLLGSAPMGFSKRLSHRVSMLAYYLRSRLSGK